MPNSAPLTMNGPGGGPRPERHAQASHPSVAFAGLLRDNRLHACETKRNCIRSPLIFARESLMNASISAAIPVLPAGDTPESLKWWTEICGFQESFRDSTPPSYVGIRRGEAQLHISGMTDKLFAKTVGDQTMVEAGRKGYRGHVRRIPGEGRQGASQWFSSN